MSEHNQQIAQAVRIIEEQLVILKQLADGGSVVQEGIVGVFDGEFMVEESGKRHQVPPNYASKTMLVPGDTIRMVEDKDGGQTKYKQIGKAERAKASGILVKKDGKYEVLTDAGSFKVLSASIKHFNGEVGDQVFIQYPKQHVKGSWAAVEKVASQSMAPAAVPAIAEIEPVLAEAAPSIQQPVSVTHAVAHREEHLAPEATPDATEAQPSPIARPAEAKPASKSKSKSGKSSSKSKNASRAESKPATKPKSSSEPTATLAAKSISTPQAVTSPVDVQTAFGDDDLV